MRHSKTLMFEGEEAGIYLRHIGNVTFVELVLLKFGNVGKGNRGSES